MKEVTDHDVYLRIPAGAGWVLLSPSQRELIVRPLGAAGTVIKDSSGTPQT